MMRHAAWAVVLTAACSSALGQEFQLLRSEHAIGSGHVALFRQTGGGWQKDALLRPSFALPTIAWRPRDIEFRQGRLIAAGFSIVVWEWDGATWREDAIFGTIEQQALWGSSYEYVATDGETIVTMISGVPDAHVFFWERRGPGVWEKVLTVRSSE